MAGLKVGAPAPDFALKDYSGKEYSLESFSEDYLVVYFYPKDDTPGCTIEAREFNKALPKYEKLGARVVGISGGDERSKQKFCQKHNLKITLLSDTNYTISKKFGVYGEKSFMGRKFNGIFRTTFLLDGQRNIVRVFENVKPEVHADEVLELIAQKPHAVPRPTVKSVRPTKKASAPKKTTAPKRAATVRRKTK